MFKRQEANTDVGVDASDVPLLLLLSISLLEFDIRVDRVDDELASNLKLEVLVIRCSSVDLEIVDEPDELNESRLIFFVGLLKKFILLLPMLLMSSNEIKFWFSKSGSSSFGFLTCSCMCRLCELFSIDDVDEVDDDESDETISSFSSRVVVAVDVNSDENVLVDLSSLDSIRLALFLVDDVVISVDDDDVITDVGIIWLSEEFESSIRFFKSLKVSLFINLLFFTLLLLVSTLLQSVHSISGELCAFLLRLVRFFLNHS